MLDRLRSGVGRLDGLADCADLPLLRLEIRSQRLLGQQGRTPPGALRQRTESLATAIWDARQAITSLAAHGYFTHCGYPACPTCLANAVVA